MEKEPKHDWDRCKQLLSGITDMMKNHMLDVDGKAKVPVEHRIADVAYTLCAALALQIKVIKDIGNKNSTYDELLELTIKSISDFLTTGDKNAVVNKDIVSAIKSAKRISKDDLPEKMRSLLEEAENNLVFKYEDDSPPKSIKDVTAFVTNEVFKTLKAEGFGVGEDAEGHCIFERDKNTGDIKYFVLRIGFHKNKEKGGKDGRKVDGGK